MTTDQPDRLATYRAALRAFEEENAPGGWKDPARRIRALDAKDAAWQALSAAEKQRAREEGGG